MSILTLNLFDFNQFSELHDFENVDFDESLRQYLWSFRLPGEAQKIDRMMEAFAARFTSQVISISIGVLNRLASRLPLTLSYIVSVTQNPEAFNHADTCYVLAFSTIMLNTALHNPSVKGPKQTLESFINMNRGIDQVFFQSLSNAVSYAVHTFEKYECSIY